MDYPYLVSSTIDFTNKTVLLRIDCDVDLKDEGGRLMVDEDYRLKCTLPTISFLLDHGVQKIIMIGHVGRPKGEVIDELKLAPIAAWFLSSLNSNIKNLHPRWISLWLKTSNTNSKPKSLKEYKITDKIVLLENVRFDKREEGNNEEFAKELAGLADIYVNEAFGVSHRQHASTAGVPKYLPAYYGLQFQKEIEKLSWLRESAPRPLVFILGGSKEDKLDYLEFLAGWADTVLVGGRLPLLIQNATCLPARQEIKMQNLVPSYAKASAGRQNSRLSTNDLAHSIEVSQYPNIKLAELTPNGLDINNESIELFNKEIARAKTVVWAGPMGKYEEEGNEIGTYEIAKAIANCQGKKFAGGGDTHRIISRLNLWDKFDFVSVGGGAMLAFLTKRVVVSVFN